MQQPNPDRFNDLLALIDGLIENTEEVIAQDGIEPDDDPEGRHVALAAYRLTREDLALVYEAER
jgi:hypothetical protein